MRISLKAKQGDQRKSTSRQLESATGAQAPIAIIGLSGRYPQAETVAQYWSNLVAGKDSITDIPADRWSMVDFFEANKDAAVEAGKSYTQAGGFLDGFSEFDTLFFGIPPVEAWQMDPQERLFLQTCWNVLEEAGYSSARLASEVDNHVGVFAGITKTGYNLLGDALSTPGQPVSPKTSFSSVANRVSYFFNFTGPSQPIDTMCAASLVAVHEACENLRRGDCRLAIAGGVNLYLHPSTYVELCALQMLSTEGRCKSFGEGGNGFVPGEGVGAVLLKPLAAAEADGDKIYGVVRGSSVNHGGKTHGYTVPNPKAQATVIRQSLDKAGIDARTVSYIEAHGTGTALGDPIEITGLSQAFATDTRDKAFCAIGSAKSNIGHLEAAAGIAGLTKVLLQLEHKTLAPSLHADTLNPNINFEKTPFRLNQTATAWDATTVDGITYPRRAGISSFGAGGVNAHMVVEEYVDTRAQATTVRTTQLIVLSAKSEARLQDIVEQLIDYLTHQAVSLTAEEFQRVAYTLQQGREPMKVRLAFSAVDADDMLLKLKACRDDDNASEIYRGQATQRKSVLSVFDDEEEMAAMVASWIAKEKINKLLSLWVKGLAIDWSQLYAESIPQWTHLPTYPFAKKSYWIDDPKRLPRIKNLAVTPIAEATFAKEQQDDDINLWQKQFAITLSGNEFFLKGYQLNNTNVIPNVALLEMVHLAVDTVLGAAEEDVSICFTDVQWCDRLDSVNAKQTIDISLFGKTNGYIAYTVTTDVTNGDPNVYCQGLVRYKRAESNIPLEIAPIIAKMDKGELNTEEAYQIFRSIGLDYGLTQRMIKKIHRGEHQLLAELQLPKEAGADKNKSILNSSLVNSAVDTIASLTARIATVSVIDSVEIIKPCTEKVYAHAYQDSTSVTATTVAGEEKWTIDIYDDQKALCLHLSGVQLVDFSANNLQSQQVIETCLFKPQWREKSITSTSSSLEFSHHVFLYGIDAIKKESLDGMVCNTLMPSEGDFADSFQELSVALFESIRSILKSKTKDNVLFQIVMPVSSDQQLLLGVSGLIRTARLENPKFAGQLIAIDGDMSAAMTLDIVKANAQHSNDQIIFYKNNTRFVQDFEDVQKEKDLPVPWKEKGVYWITGGLGGLGLIFAKEIATKTQNVNLVLTGRSGLSEEKAKEIDKLKALGAFVTYQQLDICNLPAVQTTVDFIEKSFGKLNGILHCAGLIKDNFLLNKNTSEFQQVLAPKTTGLLNLDAATQSIDLDLFVLFSSVSSLGSVGQADYASANGFMDQFSRYRNQQVSSQERSGYTVSINWPLWQDGGMSVDKATEQYLENMGLATLDTASGIDAFYQSIALQSAQTVVVKGYRDEIYKNLLTPSFDDGSSDSTVSEGLQIEAIKSKALEKLTVLFSEEIRLPVADIEVDASFEDYGIDSILITHLNRKLDTIFGRISKTLFFEYQNLLSLCDFLVDEYPQACAQWVGLTQQVVPALETSIN